MQSRYEIWIGWLVAESIVLAMKQKTELLACLDIDFLRWTLMFKFLSDTWTLPFLVFFTICGCECTVLERMSDEVSSQQRMEDMLRVAELCVDLLKENEEQHGEVKIWFTVACQ